jgi:hypothetical protein
MLCARAAHRVTLIDRASFPSDTISTHLLSEGRPDNETGDYSIVSRRVARQSGRSLLGVGPAQDVRYPPVAGAADGPTVVRR